MRTASNFWFRFTFKNWRFAVWRRVSVTVCVSVSALSINCAAVGSNEQISAQLFPLLSALPLFVKPRILCILNTINFFIFNAHIILWMSHLLLIMKLIRNRWEQYSQPKKWMTIGVSLLNELLLTVILVPNPDNGRSSSSSSWIHLTSLLVQWSIKFAG